MKSRRTRMATAVALTLGGAWGALAQAQQVAAAGQQTAAQAGGGDTLETVVVTGISASLEKSLQRKRAADSVVEVVSAEDIGKLPDKNVADAVQRLPGVNISSGSGGQGGFSENDRVSIRGTNPSLTQTTINGHAIATGDWYIGDQTNTVGRSVSFTLLPAEIVGAVEVQKSSQADYLEGGTVGNVNIVTRTPLSFRKDLTLEVTAQGMYSDLPRKTDPQFNALFNWKNPQGTFGVLLQGFSEKRHERRDGQELFLLGRGQIGTVAGGDPVALAHPDLQNVYYPTQIGSAAFTQQSKRDGGLFDVQWRASDSLTLDLNGFYSHFDGTNFDTNFMASPLNELAAGNAPTTYQVINGTLESATFPQTVFDPTNPGGSAFAGVRDSIYRPKAGSSTGYVDLDFDYQASPALRVTGQAGFTRGTGNTPHDYGYEAYLVNSPLIYQMHGTAGPAIVQFPGLDPTQFSDPSHVVNGGSWSDSVYTTDKETYGQLDLLLQVGNELLQSLKFGLRYDRHKRTDDGNNYGCALDPNDPCFLTPALALPMPAWHGTVSPGNFGSGIGMGPGYLQHFWVLNPADIAAWQQQYNSVFTGANYQGSFVVEEKVAAGYVMANLGGEHWRGNVGLRLAHTRQSSDSFNLDAAGVFEPASVSHTYTDVLPSANLRYEVSRDLIARAAVSRTLSRADYSSLSPAVTLNNLDLTGTGGNADLKPVRSDNYDLALEWYYAPQSILSLGLFYMDLPSYVTFGYNTRLLLNTTTNQLAPFVVTSPFNVAARNKGLEFSWQQPLGLGFGAVANYTYASGHDEHGADLVGSSRSTANAQLYYEAHGFSARLAYTYRSSFLVGLANVTSQYEAGIGTVAASLNYKLNDQFTFTLDGLNLNDPRLKYYSNPQQPQAFYVSGRQFFFGVRATL